MIWLSWRSSTALYDDFYQPIKLQNSSDTDDITFYYMTSVTSLKLACFDWLRNIFAGALFSLMDHDPKLVILKSNVSKLRKANSKTQKIETKNDIRMLVKKNTRKTV